MDIAGTQGFTSHGYLSQLGPTVTTKMQIININNSS